MVWGDMVVGRWVLGYRELLSILFPRNRDKSSPSLRLNPFRGLFLFLRILGIFLRGSFLFTLFES